MFSNNTDAGANMHGYEATEETSNNAAIVHEKTKS